MKKQGIVLSVLAFALAGAVAEAAEDDEMFQSSRPAAVLKAKSRNYAGARDESRLEVQASLPQPTRNADGSLTLTDEAGEPVTAPASD